jgi:uncharacterized protein
VLGQLGNWVQHALRAFTPDDAKALKATVSTFPTSGYDLASLLTQLGIGEAVVTVLSERGAPTPVAWTRLRAPLSLMGPSDPAAMAAQVAASPLEQEYGTAVDRDSAYERLAARLAPPAVAPTTAPAQPPAHAPDPPPAPKPARAPRAEPTAAEEVAKAATPVVKAVAVAAATTLGREIMRGLFGTARKRR